MKFPSQIRHLAVIGAVDHGRSTLVDAMFLVGGIAKRRSRFGEREDDEDRYYTIKEAALSLIYRNVGQKRSAESEVDTKSQQAENDEYLMNIIRVQKDFMSVHGDVDASFHLTDGVVLVVDCIEGVNAYQTGALLRKTITERIIPVLLINKVDRCILELQLDPEEVYLCFKSIIDFSNETLSVLDDPNRSEIRLCPVRGTVAFGSARHDWAFTLETFAKLYAAKFGVDEGKMRSRLWGDTYFDPEGKTWCKVNISKKGKQLKRSFCQFCLEPIYQITNAIMSENQDQVEKILKATKVGLTEEERQMAPRQLLRTVLKKFLSPVSETLFQMIIHHLPSPVAAQAYRSDLLYSGERCQDDRGFDGMKNCDPKAPLIVYVSKLVPSCSSRFPLAFGRIFAGTIQKQQKVRIMGNNYVPGKRVDLFESKTILNVSFCFGRLVESDNEISCGNLCLLSGVGKFIAKSATISDESENINPIRDKKYSVAPVVRVAVKPKALSDLPKLIQGLRSLAKFDPFASCLIDETGEAHIECVSERHLQACLQDLQNEYTHGTLIDASEPTALLRESIAAASDQLCLAKSGNRHNRVTSTAVPLTEGLSQDIETLVKEAAPSADPKERALFLSERYGWEIDDAKKIWSYGPDYCGPNVVIDRTKGVIHLNEVRDFITVAFQIVSREGLLTDNELRGVKFNIEDLTTHADAIHRGAGQFIPTAQKALSASFLSSQPRILEPISQIEIDVPIDVVHHVRQAIESRRGGVILNESRRSGASMVSIQASLPVMESFGLESKLLASTQGRTSSNIIFDHWKLIDENPFQEGTFAHKIVTAERLQKAMDPNFPMLSTFISD